DRPSRSRDGDAPGCDLRPGASTSSCEGCSGLGDAPAGRLDLLLGGGGALGRGDVQRHRDLAGAQHLDRLALADRALGDEVLDGDLTAGGVQRGQLVEVDDLVGRAEAVLEAAQLGQPHVQRGLPTLEAGRHLVAGLGALGAAARGLALGGLTTTDAGPGLLGAGGRTRVVDLQGGAVALVDVSHGQSTSSTVTRWATVRTMPRNSGRSSLTTVSPIRLSPSERRVSRCMRLPPMLDLIWVTLSWLTMHLPPPAPAAWPPARSPRGSCPGERRPPPGARAA